MDPSDAPPSKTGLVVFGILLILLAGVLLLFSGFMGVMALAMRSGRMPDTSGVSMTFAVLFYAGLAAFFLTFGIGTIRARRWARKLMLILSWIWLVSGAVGFVILSVMLPRMLLANPRLSEAPHGAMIFAIAFTAVMALVVYIIVPGVLVLFYGNRKVRAAVEVHDPGPSWTDACPAPVLAVSLMTGVCAPLMAVTMSFYGFAFPFFGTVLTGLAGGLIYLAILPLLVWIAWGLYRVEYRAWVVNFAVMAAWSVSGLVTLARQGILGFYGLMGIPPEQMEVMRNIWSPDWDALAVGATAVMLVLYMGFLVYIRRYFKKTQD